MRRPAKGFTGTVTPLFRTMVPALSATEELIPTHSEPDVAKNVVQPTTSQPTTEGGTFIEYKRRRPKKHSEKAKPSKAKRAKKQASEILVSQLSQPEEQHESPPPMPQNFEIHDSPHHEQVVNDESDHSERANPTVSDQRVEQDRINIDKTQSEATLRNDSSSEDNLSGPSTKNKGSFDDHARHESLDMIAYDSHMESHPEGDEARMKRGIDNETGTNDYDGEFRIPDSEPMVNEGDELREFREFVEFGFRYLWNELLKERKINQTQQLALTRQAVNLANHQIKIQDLQAEVEKLKKIVESYKSGEEVFERTVRPEFANTVMSSENDDEEEMPEQSVKVSYSRKKQIARKKTKPILTPSTSSSTQSKPTDQTPTPEPQSTPNKPTSIPTPTPQPQPSQSHISTPTPTVQTQTPSRPILPGFQIREQTETRTIPSNLPKIDPKDKGKGKLVEEPKKKLKRAVISEDEELARKLQAEFNAEFNDDRLIRVELDSGKFEWMTREQISKYDEDKLVAEEEIESLKEFVSKMKKKKAEEARKKKMAKPKTKAQLRKDLYHKLKAIIPVGILRNMSYEQMLRSYEADKAASIRLNRSKEEIEKEKKIKASLNERNEDIRQEVIEEDIQRKKKEEMEKFEKRLNEEDKRLRAEMEKESDMEKDLEKLQELVVEKADVIRMQPTEMKLNKIIDWRVVDLGDGIYSDRIEIKRDDGSFQFFKSFEEMCRKCTILDIGDLYRICLIKEPERLEIIREKLVYDQIMMMFEPTKYRHLFQYNRLVKSWKYFGYSSVSEVTFEDGIRLFMLSTQHYDLGLKLCRELIRVKLSGSKSDSEALNFVYMVLNQLYKKEKLAKK